MPRKKKNRLFVEEIDTIGLVDKGDDPEALIVFTKREGKGTMPKRKKPVMKASQTLRELLLELRRKVDELMISSQGNIEGRARDEAVCQVLANEPSLHGAIEIAAGRTVVEKVEEAPPGAPEFASVDKIVTEISKTMLPNDPRGGLQLCGHYFPGLMKRWRGIPA